MAATRSHAPSARLHKRGHSASSTTSPLSPLSADSPSFSFNRSETPRATYQDSWVDPSPSMAAATSSKPLKIKPYLRKLSSSSKDNAGLDLSRPAAENESLAGLGISDYGSSRTAAEVTFNPVNGRARHTRSTSNTSQFSTSSSLQRPTAPYLPPIRQTPRPYTPPISRSTPPSLGGGSENEADDIMADDEFHLRQNMFDPARRSGSVSSLSAVAPALRIQTSGSSSRLGQSYSATSLSLTSPVGSSRPRGDTLKSLDTTSPSSRTSLDKAFGCFRPREHEIDPTSRAAHIAKARMAYQEKEAAKERKYEKEANKQAQKDNRKKYKQDELLRRKSESEERHEQNCKRSISNEKPSRPSVAGKQYSDYRQAHSRSLPALVATVDPEKSTVVTPQVTRTRAAKGRWLRFVTWFKTRLLRIGRKLNISF